MAAKTKAQKAAAAVESLDTAALAAQERIAVAAEKAQAMIDAACEVATKQLEISSRVTDARDLNGSYNWNRVDRYSKSDDARLQRVEEQIDSLNKARGELNVGAAQRIEQIIGLRDECKGLSAELQLKKGEIEHLADEFEASYKELSGRVTTLRELILEVKDGLSQENDALRLEFIKQHSEAMSNLQWKIIAALSSLAFLFILVFISYSFHVFGGLP